MTNTKETIRRLIKIYKSIPGEQRYKDIFITLIWLKRVNDISNKTRKNGLIIPESANLSRIANTKDELGITLIKAFEDLEKENIVLEGALLPLSDIIYALQQDERAKNAMLIAISELLDISMSDDHYANKQQFPEIFNSVLLSIVQNRLTGEVSTPEHISKLLARLLDIRNNITIHDPFCGIGGTLIECQRLAEQRNEKVSLTGQEINVDVWRYCILSMTANSYTTADIRQGSTILNPAFVDTHADKLTQFDRVVSVPPFGKLNWGQEIADYDKYNRFRYGIPPKNVGDMAHLQHMIACLNGTGKGAMVLPQGILFRGASEERIRKGLIQTNLIEAVIMLPTKIFSTSIQMVVVIINMNKTAERNNSIQFISAENLGEESGRNTILIDNDISKIVTAYENYEDIENFSRIVKLDEIRDNDYSLSFSLYVEKNTDIETVNVKRTLQQIQQLEETRRKLLENIMRNMD